MTMTRKAMVLMAVVLAMATAATAATALAGSKHKRPMVHREVVEAINTTSLAMLRLKIKAIQLQRGNQRPQTRVMVSFRQ